MCLYPQNIQMLAPGTWSRNDPKWPQVNRRLPLIEMPIIVTKIISDGNGYRVYRARADLRAAVAPL
jgi:hypothetical protein